MFEAEYAAKHNTAQQEMEFFRREKEDLRGEVLLLRLALQQKTGTLKMKAQKSKDYNGMRKVMELENFDISKITSWKQRFKMRKRDQVTKMYLSNDATVWLRTKFQNFRRFECGKC